MDKYDPTIEDSYQKTVSIDVTSPTGSDTILTYSVLLEILDTAGTDQFAAMRELYLKTGQAFLLVYSVTSAASFHDLAAIHDQIIALNESVGAHLWSLVLFVGARCPGGEQVRPDGGSGH